MRVCPSCEGRGKDIGIACGSKGCRPMTMPCSLCGGSGSVEDARLKMWQSGQSHRRDRLARNMTLRQEADRLGISMVDLSKIERGENPLNIGQWVCLGCKHTGTANLDFPCRECSRNSMNPTDRYEVKEGAE